MGKGLEVLNDGTSTHFSELTDLTAACISQIGTCISYGGGSFAIWVKALNCSDLSGILGTARNRMQDQGFAFYCSRNALG